VRWTFARLARDDLPLLHAWLQQGHVRAHYEDGLRTLAQVADYYADVLTGADPTRAYIAAHDRTPIAYVQAYRVADYPSYAAALAITDDALGIDMLIGDPAFVHRGLGASLLSAFVDRVAGPQLGARTCWIAPAVDNPRAIRCYERAGFAHVRTVEVPGEPVPEYVMRRALA
jgi:aminoglycoside 6'-N-acetyltransferase